MLKTIIVDDDDDCRKTLSRIIHSSFQQLKIIAECADADEGKEAILNLQPDLVFLDVEMPDKTGFDLLSELGEQAYNFNTVFTTAHERYALKAIKTSAADFLLKPIDENDIKNALEVLEKKKTREQTAQQVKVLLEHYTRHNTPNKKIALPTSKGLLFAQINEIIRCESDDNYTCFFFTDKSKLIVTKTLKYWEELLEDHDFFRVHSSHLINLRYIKEYEKTDGGIVTTTDGTRIKVSRRRGGDFLLRMEQIL